LAKPWGPEKLSPERHYQPGPVDFTVFAGEFIYIIEFKVMDEDPLRQIKAQRYFEKYLAEKKEIILLGIVFNTQERNIGRMEWESWTVQPSCP